MQNQQQAMPPQPQPFVVGTIWLEKMERMKAPKFKGESKPEVALNWLREIEKIFLGLRCPEGEKVYLATYQLQERTHVWW